MKSQFQDIIPPEKRSIRNVSLSDKKPSKKSRQLNDTPKDPKPTEETIEEVETKTPWSYEPKEDLTTYGGGNARSLSNIFLWFITIGCVALLFFAVSWLFAGATISIKLKQVSVELPETIPLRLTPGQNEVGYSSITFTEAARFSLEPKGKKEVLSKSIGTVLIYNNYGGSSQKLISGTRLETPEGLIYKLDQAVTVPGKKAGAPGSVEAKVTAAEAGPKYNIGLTDFTIPGFKGDPKFEGFYARSKTVMTGGSSGTVAIVDDSELTKSVEKLKVELSRALKDRAIKELPSNQLTVDNMQVESFKVGDPLVTGETANVEVVGELKVYTIDSNSLARYLLSQKDIQFLPNDSFKIDTTNVSTRFGGVSSSTLDLSLSGPVVIKYIIDSQKFKADIAGKSKSDVLKITASNYPQVTSISTTIKPFWHTALPQSISKITIVED